MEPSGLNPLTRTDMDFVDCIYNDNKIKRICKVVGTSGYLRPSGDNVMDGPTKSHELIYVGSLMVALLDE